ncbi:chemotaxis protein CheA [Natronospirillum operosum]|uniref:Chemotaxis protein CheA n=1 Tax=Natronospirillum operosum TaxID=2759953 RepID=A0A4Z0WGW4_9GAMM|nr:chemotaxis protein CheA [Natronospirillum operosum]TGG95788.1 chemotaxis protein CheA [Natronospirillum operosum]
MTTMATALQTFLDESRELLSDMELLLLAMESRSGEPELQNALFRCVHTIKGSAGMFGLDHVVDFTHVVENVLDRLRAGEIALSRDLANLLLRCRDHISLLVEVPEPSEAAALQPGGVVLLAGLEPFHSCAGSSHAQTDSTEPVAAEASRKCRIDIRIHADALRHGMDPLGFIRFLGTLGDVAAVRTLEEKLPVLGDMDPETCYLDFEIDLVTSADRIAIENIFELASDLYQIEVQDQCPVTEVDPVAAPLPAQPDTDESVESAAPGAEEQADTSQQNRRRKQVQHFRIQADKLDNLINLVGELVISSAAVSLGAEQSGDTPARESAANLNLLVEAIRDSSLDLRMVPIGETFQRFQRVVRDVASELGKDIELVVTGADTELDKTVVEKIGDPLTHLVRNACDHGVEAPAARSQKGKPTRGRVHLNAYHESGSIIIEVSDDGGGLSRERILAKAMERELVRPDAVLTDQDVFNLIFEPGFSTVEQVTNLSGRGVGMDVVRRNIESLRGTVELVSPGVLGGTTFRIRLPLTLAIIDGFMARVGDATYVVPLEMVVECTELSAEQQLGAEQHYINLRQEVLPLIRLRAHFKLSGELRKRQNIIVVRHGGQKAGLIVDELLGENQTVIKPLGGIFSNLRGLSGSTILGNGQVALILDVPTLIQQVARQEDAANRGFQSHARPRLSAS